MISCSKQGSERPIIISEEIPWGRKYDKGRIQCHIGIDNDKTVDKDCIVSCNNYTNVGKPDQEFSHSQVIYFDYDYIFNMHMPTVHMVCVIYCQPDENKCQSIRP